MRLVKDVLTAAFFGLLVVMALCLVCGCETNHNVKGGQTHEINVHHDDQRLDIWIHKDRKRIRNPPPKQP